MILLRKLFAKKDSKDKKKEDKDKALATGGIVGGGLVLSKTKPGRLTGKVVRYHDAPIEVIDKIKEEGLKAKYAEDPNNLTNRVTPDVPMEEKKNLVYTAKKKRHAFGVGTTRASQQEKIDQMGALKEQLTGKSKHHKVLKLEFDYDDIKGKKRIKNPELRGAKNAKEFFDKVKKNNIFIADTEFDELNPIAKKTFKDQYKILGEGTHIFEGDVDPSHIVGGKGYKKRTLKQVAKYIKNNPGRFGKEAAKVATGAALVGYGAKKAVDYYKDKNKKDKK